MKELTERQAWAVMAHWWKYYHRTGKHMALRRGHPSFDRYITQNGMCYMSKSLYMWKLISFDDTLKINKRIRANLLLLAEYMFPVDREHALKRAEFCEKQLNILNNEKEAQ